MTGAAVSGNAAAPVRPAVRAGTGPAPRVAVAGAGLMGRWHAHAARAAGAEVVAVADPDGGAAARLGRGAAVFADLGALLDAVLPEALHVCAPSGTHEALIGEALDRGVHVLCEKPLAGDLAATRALLDRAGARGRVLCPTHQYAFERSVERVVRLWPRLGRVARVDLAFHTAGGDRLGPGERAGLAADILPHPLSILQRLPLAQPLAAADWRLEPSAAGEWAFAALPGGVAVRILVSTVVRPTEATLTVRGSAGTARADLYHDFATLQGGGATRTSKALAPIAAGGLQLGTAAANLAARALRREPAYPGLQRLVGLFYAACRGAPQPIDAAASLEVAALRDVFLARVRGGGAP